MKIEWILIVFILCVSTRVYSFDFTVKFESLEQFDQFQRIVADNLEFNYNHDHYFTSFEYFESVRKSVLKKGVGFNQREVSRILRSIILSKNVHSRKLVWLFLAQGVPPYVKDEEGWAPIHYAASVGKVDIIKDLQFYGTSLNVKNRERNTALSIGVQEGHFEVVRYLLSQNAGKYLSNKLGDTLLHTAVRSGADEKTMKLLISNRVPLEFQNKEKLTALHLAVSKGLFKYVKILLEAGIFVDVRDGDGNTALHLAVLLNYQKITELLIQYGADINAKNNMNETPLYYAILNHNIPLVRLLLKKGVNPDGMVSQGEAAIHASIRGRNSFKDEKKIIEMLELLLEYHADINKKHAGGDTLLHQLVVRTGNLDIIKFVIEKGGDVHAVNRNNETPFLRISWINSRLKKLEILLDYGSDINAQDEDGNTALHNAVMAGNEELVEFLLARGADPQRKNNKGQTAFALLLRNRFSKYDQLEQTEVERIAQLFYDHYRRKKFTCSDAFR